MNALTRRGGACLRTLASLALVCPALCAPSAPVRELAVEDFRFDGPLGSHGATIARVGPNHFKVSLGAAPQQPTWCNMLYFQIVRHAKGNELRLDVEFAGGKAYRFNHNAATWSHDGEHWTPIAWVDPRDATRKGDSLLFPRFMADQVYFGAQVPMSYEGMERLVTGWDRHPHATVRVLGESLGKRKIYRLEITDPASPHPPGTRWGHWFGNQHPGEHNAQWRMAGMIDWLLSDAGADCRRRSVCHFVMMTSPDGPSHGWYRVNAQGVDMNRSYFPEGADPVRQAHEACVVQQDLEKLMKSPTPLTTAWSMHTWAGPVEPILLPGPEIGTIVGPWERFRDILLKHDPAGLVEPLKTRQKPTKAANAWNNGPNAQFGVTNVLCEGAGDCTSKQQCLDAGVALMKSIAEYYAGTRPAPAVTGGHARP